MGVFVDTKGQIATLSMETGVFMDKGLKLMAPARKMGVFMATNGKMTASARKRSVFMAAKGDKRKRDTLERVSPYMALSREGRLKNRGRPWPREREGPNVVGRDSVFQPSLPAITY